MSSSIDPFLVRTLGVTRTYKAAGQPVHALRGVDLELPRGMLAVLKGRSGSGKTTLLNIIGGLDKPTEGSVIVDGQALEALSENDLNLLRRRQMGFIFQSFALLPAYSAYENVELILRIAGMRRPEQVERTHRCLRAVGLPAGRTTVRTRCPVVSSSGLPSPEHWQPDRS
jgi:putative ABC transport system ATP-binding protein